MKQKDRFSVDQWGYRDRGKFCTKRKALSSAVFRKKYKKLLKKERIKKRLKRKYVTKKFKRGVLVKGKKFFQVQAEVTFLKKDGKKEKVTVTSYAHKKKGERISEKEISECLQEAIEVEMGLYHTEFIAVETIHILTLIRWIKK